MKQLIFSFLLITLSTNALGEVFCVGSSQELQTALDTAKNNGEDDEIRIRSGDYSTINNARFSFINSEEFDLKISGGWSDFGQLDCLSKLGRPLDTKLDANDNSEVIFFTSNSMTTTIEVSNLSIVNGSSDSLSGGAGMSFSLLGIQTGEVLIDQIYFAGNEGPDGSALNFIGNNLLTVRNSVFRVNTTDTGRGAVWVSMGDTARGLYFINNTLINNFTNLASTATSNASGLSVNLNQSQQNIPQSLIANNLFWYNDNSDFYVTFSGGLNYLYNNNYEFGGGFLDDEASNMSVQPLLSPFLLNFTPEPGSPLIDRGLQMPDIPDIVPLTFLEEWDHGVEDFDRGIFVRVVNNRVDIGAVESPPEVPIFKNGFD